VIGCATILWRLFILQVKNHQEYLAKAQSQQRYIETIQPERGEIFLVDKDGKLHPIATNRHSPYVYIVPKEIVNPVEVSKTLADILNISEENILKKAQKAGDPYEMILRNISDEAAKKISSIGLKGVYIDSEKSRFYPFGEIASDVIGFVRKSDDNSLKGEYGIEALYDNLLKGKPGIFTGIRDARGNRFFGFQNSLPQKGSDIILTIDPNIQFRAQELLKETAKKWSAQGGNVIVMNAKSGEILALANFPSFDPNNFSKEKNIKIFINETISLRFEPGSVFKPITMAIALDKGVINPDTLYNDVGEIKIGGYTIRNSDLRAHGNVTMTKVLEQSYNTGAVFAATKLGNDVFRDFLSNTLHIDDKTGIDLPAEIKGDLSGLWPPNARPINFATAAFGQGIAITPIKLAQIFAAFANGGKLIQPRIVKYIKHADNKIEQKNSKIENGKIISDKALSDLIYMLTKVVEEGTGKRARIKGYTIAGKTGTAQVPNQGKPGYSDDTIHTFAMFTPYTDPPIVILFKLDKPIGVRYAEGSVVGPSRELMEFVINYYGIAPDKPEELEE
jgi:cell division protein FtsI/penicillin-binding protein 2